MTMSLNLIGKSRAIAKWSRKYVINYAILMVLASLYGLEVCKRLFNMNGFVVAQ